MRETVYFVASYLTKGFSLEDILNDFKADYLEDNKSANPDDFKSAVEFYGDIEEEIHEKRRRFLLSCDNDPSESLDEMWSEEVGEFYTDLYFN